MLRQITQQGRRFMNAIQIGTQAGMSAYRSGGGVGTSFVFSSYQSRTARYGLYDAWYENIIFSDLSRYLDILRQHRALYKLIRGIYNPVERLVNLEVAKTYGGQIDWTGGLRTGAIPIVGADPTLVTAIETVLKWSNFGTEKGPYVRQGAKFGDSFLKVIDDVNRGRVRLEVLDPHKVRECRFDEVGNITFIAIQYFLLDDENREYLYREEIDAAEFRYWRAYDIGAIDGAVWREPDERHPNAYGFVPVRHVPHKKDTHSRYGRTSFSGSLGKIIELNDQASLAHDAARKALNPIYVAKGGRLPDEDSASRERDEIIVLNIPKDGDVTTITPAVDMQGILGNIDRVISEIERDMPQLALQRLREKGGVAASGVAIENSYSDASELLIEVQGNYDEGLIRALQMAISIGAFRGYKQFPYDPVKSFEDGDLEFYIRQREVFTDRLTTEQKLTLLVTLVGTPVLSVGMRDLGYSEEDIEAVTMTAAEQKAEDTAAAIRGLAQGAFGDMSGQDMTQMDSAVPDPTAANAQTQGALING